MFQCRKNPWKSLIDATEFFFSPEQPSIHPGEENLCMLARIGVRCHVNYFIKHGKILLKWIMQAVICTFRLALRLECWLSTMDDSCCRHFWNPFFRGPFAIDYLPPGFFAFHLPANECLFNLRKLHLFIFDVCFFPTSQSVWVTIRGPIYIVSAVESEIALKLHCTIR